MGFGFLNPIKKAAKHFVDSHQAFAKNPDKQSFGTMIGSATNMSLGGHGGMISSTLDAVDQPSLTSDDPSKSGSASDQMAGITRAQWDDYMTRFKPYEARVADIATGQADNEAAIARARSSVAGAFDVSQGTLSRNRERLGLSTAGVNADEQPALQARTGLSRTAAEVSAINGARTETTNRDRQLLGGNMAIGLKPEQK